MGNPGGRCSPGRAWSLARDTEQEGWDVGEQEKLGAREATADRTGLPPSHNTHGWAQKLAQGRSCHGVSTGPRGLVLTLVA